LRGLPQSDRQDAKHLRMLVLIVRQWLREQFADPRKVFRAVERLAMSTASPDGLHAFAQESTFTKPCRWTHACRRRFRGLFPTALATAD